MRDPDGARTCSRNWPASTAGKKVLAEPRCQRQRAGGEAEHQRQRHKPVLQRPAEQALVGGSQALELVLEAAMKPPDRSAPPSRPAPGSV